MKSIIGKLWVAAFVAFILSADNLIGKPDPEQLLSEIVKDVHEKLLQDQDAFGTRSRIAPYIHNKYHEEVNKLLEGLPEAQLETIITRGLVQHEANHYFLQQAMQKLYESENDDQDGSLKVDIARMMLGLPVLEQLQTRTAAYWSANKISDEITPDLMAAIRHNFLHHSDHTMPSFFVVLKNGEFHPTDIEEKDLEFSQDELNDFESRMKEARHALRMHLLAMRLLEEEFE